MPIKFRVKRIYDEPEPEDGFRLLADRLWPRGVSKEAAHVDLWAKELTPSHELRKWFHASPDQIKEFTKRYKAELAERHDEIKTLFESLDQKVITLVTATKDLEHGHVVVLKAYIKQLLDRSK